MPSSNFSGSVLVAPGTPRMIGTITTTGNYQWFVDKGRMEDGDEVELRIGTSVGVGGTVSLLYDAAYADRQGQQIASSEPFPVVRTTNFHISMSSGGARWFPFEVISI